MKTEEYYYAVICLATGRLWYDTIGKYKCQSMKEIKEYFPNEKWGTLKKRFKIVKIQILELVESEVKGC